MPADSCFISVIVILCVVKVYRGPGLTSLWTSSVMLTKCPPLTRTEELEPAFTRQNIAEWAINVLKYHLHANTGTTHSSRPGQRELLISRIHYSCTATLHWLLQPAGKYLMRRIKIFHINYIPVAGGLGGVSWTVAWCWPAHALPPVPLLLLMVRYQDQELRSTEVKSDHRSRCWSSIYCTRCNGENV